MDLKRLKQTLNEYTSELTGDDKVREALDRHRELKSLIDAVMTEWAGTEEERFAAFGIVQEHINALRVVVSGMQEDLVTQLQQIHRGKKSVSQYNAVRGQ